MKRTRRHKYLQAMVFSLLYLIINVYSKDVNDRDTIPIKVSKDVGERVSPTSTLSPKYAKIATSTLPSKMDQSNVEKKLPTASPTWRPKRNNCTPPAIEQFPRPLIGPWARKNGGIIIHVLVAIYTFFGLAIVCDEYFVASLDRICEELKMSPDVAGATFMAAGSSAPELATVVIGVFLAQDDIGISGVIGSAVFNIMFVISVCALCAGTVSYLNWWPLVRDCFFYAVSILVMLFTIYDELITWGESLFMLFMYVVYCIVLHFNTPLEKWAQGLPVPCKTVDPNEGSGLVSYKSLDEEKRGTYGSKPEGSYDNAAEQDFGGAPAPQPAPINAEIVTGHPQNYYKPKDHSERVDPLVKPSDPSLLVQLPWAIVYPIHYLCIKTTPDCRTEKYKNWYPFTFLISMAWISFYSYFMVWMITIIDGGSVPVHTVHRRKTVATISHFFFVPVWLVPAGFISRRHLPTETLLGFRVARGTTMGIPDTVMGLTFVAAGVSVPDALSSIAVIKEGYGDMAVSNAVGSNVFDILVCLGLPWFLQTAIIKPGSTVNVISKGLTYSTLSLLSTVLFLVVATHLNGWKLDRKYGIILMIWYLLFITFASLYELNVFGPMNPAECPTKY